MPINYFTYNKIIQLLSDIADAHQQINEFAHGELWEVEGHIKPGIEYPMLFAVPVQTTQGEQVDIRTFTLLVFDQVKKDKTNETEIVSDTELILMDVIKVLREESDDYEVVGEPTLFPFKEDFGDWCAGWRADVQIQTNGRSNYCDVPMDNL